MYVSDVPSSSHPSAYERQALRKSAETGCLITKESRDFGSVSMIWSQVCLAYLIILRGVRDLRPKCGDTTVIYMWRAQPSFFIGTTGLPELL
jgi:hypothetical protein